MSALAGKVALITGGRSGIGRATADLLAAQGAKVFTAQRGADGSHDSVVVDLSGPDAPQAVIDEVHRRAGRLDILINNAGLMLEGTALEMSAEDWARTLQLNLTAPFLLIKHALPLLIETTGTIVNVGSVEGLGSNPRHPAYCASKAGLHGLTRAVAVDHGPDGVRCNAVAPGWIDTDLNEDFIESQPDPGSFRDRLGTIHPVGRTGTPGEVASLIVWLAGPESGFVTGQIFTIDGGRMAKLSLP
ncbi:MAG: SDR family oxidoreductase [Pseudomonadota bacterium]